MYMCLFGDSTSWSLKWYHCCSPYFFITNCKNWGQHINYTLSSVTGSGHVNYKRNSLPCVRDQAYKTLIQFFGVRTDPAKTNSVITIAALAHICMQNVYPIFKVYFFTTGWGLTWPLPVTLQRMYNKNAYASITSRLLIFFLVCVTAARGCSCNLWHRTEHTE